VWEARIDGRPLRFRLTGINNQNFIMRDGETGSWWQQVTGEAIQGPLRGKRLEAVFCDEVSFAIWRRETPQGRVLRPDERMSDRYAPPDWEDHLATLPVVTASDPADPFAPRTLVAGVSVNGESRAYPLRELQAERLILDRVGGVPLFVVIGGDDASVRAFDRRVDGRELEFFASRSDSIPPGSPLHLLDGETGSTWDFTGAAVRGPLSGKQLTKIAVMREYWFDWRIYHPQATAYAPGPRH